MGIGSMISAEVFCYNNLGIMYNCIIESGAFTQLLIGRYEKIDREN